MTDLEKWMIQILMMTSSYAKDADGTLIVMIPGRHVRFVAVISAHPAVKNVTGAVIQMSALRGCNDITL